MKVKGYIINKFAQRSYQEFKTKNIDQNSTGILCFVFKVLCGVCINGGGKGKKKRDQNKHQTHKVS